MISDDDDDDDDDALFSLLVVFVKLNLRISKIGAIVGFMRHTG